MGRVAYSLQRVELLRTLAASTSDDQSRRTILSLAGTFERRARDKAAALESIMDRIGAL